MKVTTLRSEPFSVNVHLVDLGEEALLVDASSGGDMPVLQKRLADALGGDHVDGGSRRRGQTAWQRGGDLARIRTLYLTHWHVDHTAGAAALKEATGARTLIHEDEAEAVRTGDGRSTLAAFSGLSQPRCEVETVREGHVLQMGGRRFEVLLVPGHSPAHTALYEPESRSLFGGDLVFAMGSFGRVDFPGCDPAAMLDSIRRVAKMDVENLYPGHLESIEGDANAAIAWSLENAEAMLG